MKKLLKVLLVVFVVSVLAITLIACKKDPCKDGHNWDKGTVTKEATCTADGVKTFTCMDCKTTRTEKIDALDHDWDMVNLTDNDATCLQGGHANAHCLRTGCNETKSVETQALGHDWNEGVVTTPATCTTDGEKTFTCQRATCDASTAPATKTEVVAKLGHEYVDNKCVRFDACGEELTPEQVVAALLALEKPAEPAYGTNVALYKGTFQLTGTITNIVTAYSAQHGNITVDIDVNGTTIQAYRLKADESVSGMADAVATLGVGDTITVSGALKYFYNKKWIAEFDTGCLLKAVTKTQHTITWPTLADATITLATDAEAQLPTTVDGGSTVAFKVTPESGKQVSSVKANGTAIDPIENGNHEMIYSVVISGNTEITVTISNDGTPTPASFVKVEFSNSTIQESYTANGGYTASGAFDFTYNETTWSTVGFNNNKNNTVWSLVKAFGSGATHVDTATITVTLEKEITSIVVNAKTTNGCAATVKVEVLKEGSVIYTSDSAAIPDTAGNVTVEVHAFEANCQYRLTFNQVTKPTANGGIEVYSINYYAITCDHQWGSENVLENATCTTAGKKSEVCSVCGCTKISATPLSNNHTWTAPVKVATAAGADELGNAAYYLCTVCNHYYTEGEESAWVDLGTDADAALAAVRIHKDDHEPVYAADPANAGQHTVTCSCGYTTVGACDAEGEDNACSHCGYKNADATYVDVTVSYVVGGAEATSEAPANLELIWKDAEKNTIETAVSKLESGKTYYIALNLNNKYTLGTVKIGGTEATADEGNYEVIVASEAISIEISVTVISEPVTVTMTKFSDVNGSLVDTATETTDGNITFDAHKGTASTDPGVYNDEIRVYQGGGYITITAANDKKIKSIIIGSSMATTVEYTVDGGDAVTDNALAANETLAVTDIDATTIVFTCRGTDKNSRLYVNYIQVVYE